MFSSGSRLYQTQTTMSPKSLMQILQITYEGKHARMEELCKLQAEYCQASKNRGILEYTECF